MLQFVACCWFVRAVVVIEGMLTTNDWVLGLVGMIVDYICSMGHFPVVAMGHLVVRSVGCCKEWLVGLLLCMLGVAGFAVVVPADSYGVHQPSMDFLVPMLLLIVVLLCLLLLAVDVLALLVVLVMAPMVLTCFVVFAVGG